MENTVQLKDGTDLKVRPMSKDDVDRSHTFFLGLAETDRRYLRTDVTRREVVERRIRKMDTGEVKRLVAVADDRIVADGSLEKLAEAGARELRLIVARPYRRVGLGMVMARELYSLAASDRVERVIVKMMRPQEAAQSIFRRIGFREVEVLPKHVKDQSGELQDLIVMACDLEAMWRELESFFAAGDWQRTR